MDERRIAIGDGVMTYLVSGGDDNPIILYIHGNVGCRSWYRDVMDVPGYRVLAPDMPNFSKSSPSGDYSMAGYARSLETFLETETGIGVGGTDTTDREASPDLILVGHSLGGVVAMEMVARAMEGASGDSSTEDTGAGSPVIAGMPVRGMVLVSPAPIEGLVTPRDRYPVIETFRTDRNLLKSALGAMVPTLENPGFLDELVDEGLKMDADAFLGHPEELATADYTERLGRLPFPALIIRGDADMLITRDMGTRTAYHLNAVYRELKGVGHSPMVEKPPLFLSVLKEFLE